MDFYNIKGSSYTSLSLLWDLHCSSRLLLNRPNPNPAASSSRSAAGRRNGGHRVNLDPEKRFAAALALALAETKTVVVMGGLITQNF